jgi:NAD(P)-dependent dehydrogenase (short-subunit alcohol dehydrogenase family)
VTGVGPGLGRSIALALAAAGADVVLAARTKERLDDIALEVGTVGHRVVTVPCDVADADACGALARAAGDAFGRVDVVVNSAYAEEDWREPFSGFDPARWRTPFAVNVFGSLQVTQACLPLLRAAGGGSVVMITTLSTKMLNPVLAGYSASKAGLTSAAQAIAKELGPEGIRVNCVAPGHIWGDPLRGYFRALGVKRGIPAEHVAYEIAAGNALGRISTPEEVARVVLFFASGLSRAITGQTLHVSCGRVFH